MYLEIKNNNDGVWILTPFGAYGPNFSSAVYLFTREEARRVLKSRSKSVKLQYTVMQSVNGFPNIDGDMFARVYVESRSIQFGCQMWVGADASKLRKWALAE